MNNGSGVFVDPATAAFPSAAVGHYGAVVAFDVDSDGDVDVFLPGIAGSSSVMLVNAGNGTFHDESSARLVPE